MNIFTAFESRTKDAAGTPPRRHLMRVAGRGLSTLAPELASYLAGWVWSSPPPSRSNERPRRGAQALEVQVGAHIAHGFQSTAASASSARVLVQHGWGGSVSKMHALIEALLEAGATVVAFDAMGHGNTGWGRHGWRQSSLIEMSDLVLAVDQKFGPFDAIVAHSAGVAAVARALRLQVRVRRAVFLSPLVDPLGQAHVLSEALGLTASVAERWPNALLERFATTRAEIDTMRPPAGEHMPETLIFQDQEDRFSPPEDARRLRDAWPGARLIETHGLGHSRICQNPTVLSEMVRFVTDASDHEAPRDAAA